MLEFVTKSHFWLQTFPALNQPQFWMTDFAAAPGFPDAQRYDLPAWMPQKVFINRMWIRAEQPTSGQIAAHIDTNRRAYATGTPPYHQAGSFPGGFADFSHFNTLASLQLGHQEVVERYWPPKVLDRSTDSLWLQADVLGGATATVGIDYIVPASDQPDDAGWSIPGAPPPPPGAQRSATPPSGNIGAGFGYTNIDRSWKIANSLAVAKIDVYSLVATAVTPKIVKRNSAGNYDVVLSLPSSAHAGAGWQSFTTSYTTPATGDYHAGFFSSGQINANPSTARAFVSGDAVGSGLTFSEDVNNAAAAGVQP